MKFLYPFFIVLILWGFLAESCMTFRMADSEAKRQFADKGVSLITSYSKINDQRIHYARTGNEDSATLLFVHGTPGSWDAFAGYMKDEKLLARFRMISVDRPGFGYSDFGKVYNLAGQAKALNAWIKEIKNGKPIYLVGHSLGGPMIIKLAAEDPELCNGLVVISGSLDPAQEKPERWRLLFKTPLNLLLPGAFKPSNEELWYLKKDLYELESDYARIKCPVYFIHGVNDKWVPPGNVEYGRKMLVNASAIGEMIIADGNHFIPWTKHKEIREVLLSLGKIQF